MTQKHFRRARVTPLVERVVTPNIAEAPRLTGSAPHPIKLILSKKTKWNPRNNPMALKERRQE